MLKEHKVSKIDIHFTPINFINSSKTLEDNCKIFCYLSHYRDAHNMSKDVKEAFIDILSDYFQDKGIVTAIGLKWIVNYWIS